MTNDNREILLDNLLDSAAEMNNASLNWAKMRLQRFPSNNLLIPLIICLIDDINIKDKKEATKSAYYLLSAAEAILWEEEETASRPFIKYYSKTAEDLEKIIGLLGGVVLENRWDCISEAGRMAGMRYTF